ncbi:MAG: RelA/SpoT family protein [Patescibacteria group bacterium]
MTFAKLSETIKEQHRPEDEQALITKAYEFADTAHKGQKRKSGAPYITHPLATALRLAEMNLDAQTIAAGLLHDVCEDTDIKIDQIKKEFGDTIAFLVEGVTKLDKVHYHGNERSAESLRKMFLAIGEDIRIVLIKLVDRLHNMSTLEYLPPDKQRRIALETLEIYAPLSYRLGIGELKGQLEDLAFKYVYPNEYQWLTKSLSDHFEWRAQFIEQLKIKMAEELTRENIGFLDIHARAKHLYSLYRKLMKYDMDLDKVYDLLAIRIVVNTVEDCYASLGVIHKCWKPVPGLMKDYISLPKPNGYRSLHTTVFGPEGRTVEFQIRTQEMHNEAENGIAAHWSYTEKKSSTGYAKRSASFAPQKELAWIEQLRDWQKDFDKPDEFLEALKIDFFKNRIFVLTPKGDAIDLPEGATPVDAAYRIHTDIGDTAVGARVNGKMVALDYILKNREIVDIITQKNKKPNRDWLLFVKTAAARQHISSFLKKSEQAKKFEKRKGELVELHLSVHDRVGLLRDISSVFARQKINMKNVATESKHRAYPMLIIQTPIKSQTDLEHLLVKLKEVKGVEEISYKLLV